MIKECALIKQFKEKGLSWLDWNEHKYLSNDYYYSNAIDGEEIDLMEKLSRKYGKGYEDGMSFVLSKDETVKIYNDGKAYSID